jgi:uncharacterized membrane protein YbhN (UPF0104 family)
LVVAYIKSVKRLKKSIVSVVILGFGVFTAVLFGILISFVPSSDLKTNHSVLLYEIELITGPLLFLIVGWLLYKFRRVRHHH